MPLIVLLAGLTLSILVSSFVREWEESHNQDEINFRSESRLVTIRSSFDSMLATAEHISAYVINHAVEHHSKIRLKEFTAVVEHGLTADEKQGLKVMAWLPHMPEADRSYFDAMMVSEYGHKIEMTDYNGKKVGHEVHSGTHYPLIVAFITEDSGLRAGIDLALKKRHRDHMKAAAESDRIAIDLHLMGRKTAL